MADLKLGPLNKIWARAVVDTDPRLSDKSKVVFGRLVDRFNPKSGCCWPSEGLLAEELNCTERTVRTAINELGKCGYIKIRRNMGPKGCNLYVVWLPVGKSEYQKAESFCSIMRKKTSGKPSKRKSKNPEANLDQPDPLREMMLSNGGFEDANEAETSRQCKKQLSKRRASLESSAVKFLRRQGSNYEALMLVDSKELDLIFCRYSEGNMSRDEAHEKILSLCQEC